MKKLLLIALLIVGFIYSQQVSCSNVNQSYVGWHKYISPGINFSYDSKEGIKFTGWQISIGVFNTGSKEQVPNYYSLFPIYYSLSIGQDTYQYNQFQGAVKIVHRHKKHIQGQNFYRLPHQCLVGANKSRTQIWWI